MFLFESAILMCSIMSSSALYSFHTHLRWDYQRTSAPLIDRHEIENDGDVQPALGQSYTSEETQAHNNGAGHVAPPDSLKKHIIQQVAQCGGIRRDGHFRGRIDGTTRNSQISLSSHPICCRLTLYGLPINTIRDFYLEFNKLKQRLVAFSSYRRLPNIQHEYTL